MKTVKSLNALFIIALFAILIYTVTAWDIVAIFCSLAVAGMLLPKNVTLMAVTKEAWKNDIIENLFKNNEWALRAVNADAFVIQGKIVHIPVAGAPATITKNQTSFPQAAVKRVDTELTYEIDTYYAAPHQIEKIEQYELSYDKRQSVVGEDTNALIEACMDGLLYRWAPLVGKTVLLDGAGVVATLSGATGNRTSMTAAAFESIKLSMDAVNIPANGRVALLTAHHYNQFMKSLPSAERTDVGRVANLATGVIGTYLGFTIYMRSTVLRYRGADGAYVVVDEQDAGFGASDKTQDRAASLFWQETQVERAKGEINMFDDTNSPYYYGDVYSFNMRLGGRIRRVIGVYAAVEGIAA